MVLLKRSRKEQRCLVTILCQSRPTPTKPAMRPGLKARTGRLRANAPGSGRRSAWDVDLSLGKSELLSKIVAQQTTDLIVRQRRNIAFGDHVNRFGGRVISTQ